MIQQFKKRAFTLIEISIVLVVIGIILASVMKGRELIQSSHIKEFNQGFVSPWVTSTSSYFTRMGKNIGDADNDGFTDGTYTLTTADFDAAGIDLEMVVMTDTSSELTRNVNGEFRGKQTVTVTVGSATINSKQVNYIQFGGIPQDVGQAIDSIWDGKADGTKGMALNVDATTTPTAWAGGSTTANGNLLIILPH